jgi:DNA modification methylase
VTDRLRRTDQTWESRDAADSVEFPMRDPLCVGDARDLNSLGLRPGSVRCTITSPPYWDLKTYADGDEREIGCDQSKQDYLEAVGLVLEQVAALSREDGVLWLVADTMRDRSNVSSGLAELTLLPFELAEVARDKGWRLQDIVIWHKDKTLPYSGQGKLRNLMEYVLFFTRSGDFLHRPFRCTERHIPKAEWLAGWPDRYHPLGLRLSNVWKIDLETQGMWDHLAGRHACPFPQELVARCIELTTDKGDVVLDPFAGIGTVIAQAIAMGRSGVGMELNPANVETFQEHVLPEFQKKWEADAAKRRLERADQRSEAELIMQLRLLKAGKELLKAVQRLANARADGHPAAQIERVAVLGSSKLGTEIDVDAGTICRAGGDLLLVGEMEPSEQDRLRKELSVLQSAPPFTTFGVEFTVDTVTAVELAQRADVGSLLEFGLSRKGAFTAPLDDQLFESPPQLVTDLSLPTAVPGDSETELDRARKRGERQLLTSELAAGYSMEVIAQRIGVPQAELRRLLIEHQLLDKPQSFAVSLPGQLAMPPETQLP